MRTIVQVALVLGAAAGLAGRAHAVDTAAGGAATDKGQAGAVQAVGNMAKTPAPGGPVPIPYPNIGQGDKDAQKKTTDAAKELEGKKAPILLTPIEAAPGAAARQTPKTDFGSVLGRGTAKTADVALEGRKEPGQPDVAPPPRVTPPVGAAPVRIPVVVAPPVPIPVPVAPPVKLAPLPLPVVIQPVQAPALPQPVR